MSTVTFDTAAAARRLRESGFSEGQAEAIIETLRQAQADLVNKSDLQAAVQGLKIWTGGVGVVLFAALASIKYFG